MLSKKFTLKGILIMLYGKFYKGTKIIITFNIMPTFSKQKSKLFTCSPEMGEGTREILKIVLGTRKLGWLFLDLISLKKVLK